MTEPFAFFRWSVDQEREIHAEVDIFMYQERRNIWGTIVMGLANAGSTVKSFCPGRSTSRAIKIRLYYWVSIVFSLGPGGY